MFTNGHKAASLAVTDSIKRCRRSKFTHKLRYDFVKVGCLYNTTELNRLSIWRKPHVGITLVRLLITEWRMFDIFAWEKRNRSECGFHPCRALQRIIFRVNRH